MKLGHANAPVEISGGAGAATTFTIAMNPKAFRVLSDTMYQNKIGSMVRETSCNAKDAHVAAKKTDVPFIIHLPDAFEPWYSVKDFGTGLSPQSIPEVFTVYFGSTKDQDNDAIGAFGLGAKTPFSYTDQFTVTSVYEGVRTIYSAYIAETGLPTILPMDSSPTDEPNGVEIKVSVKREDYNTFAQEVAAQLRFFKVKPLVQNKTGFNFNSVSLNLIVENDDVAISSDSAGYGQQWAHIIQGDVGYPLDISQINSKLTNKKNSELLNTLTGYQTRFFFKIGEIGVTASREGIEYNATTIKNIEAKLDAVRGYLVQYIEGKMKGLANDWERAKFLNGTGINRIAQASGIEIPGVSRGTNGMYFFNLHDVFHKEKDAGNGKMITVPTGELKEWTRHRSIRGNTSDRITPNEQFVIALRDTSNRPNIRAKHYLATHNNISSIIELAMFDVADNTDALIAKIKKTLGGFSKVIRLSEVEPPAKEVDANGKARSAYTRPTHYAYNHSNCQYAPTSIRTWEREYDALTDAEDDVVYVTIKDMELLHNDEHPAVQSYVQINRFQPDTPKLVGIRENDLGKIEGNAAYTKLVDFVAETKEQFANDHKAKRAWKYRNDSKTIENQLGGYFIQPVTCEMIMNKAPTSPIAALLRLRAKAATIAKSVNNIDYIASLLGWTTGDFEKRDELYGKIVSQAQVKFPLMKVIGDWQIRTAIPVEHFVDYLDAMSHR